MPGKTCSTRLNDTVGVLSPCRCDYSSDGSSVSISGRSSVVVGGWRLAGGGRCLLLLDCNRVDACFGRQSTWMMIYREISASILISPVAC